MAVEKGCKHDFRIFKESKTAIARAIQLLTDSGYQRIQKIHGNSLNPVKGTKKKPLSKKEKAHNHEVGSQRVMVEHIMREMKTIWIQSQSYCCYL